MAKETINDIIQGLIDVDKGVIGKINTSVDNLDNKINSNVSNLNNKIDSNISYLNNKIDSNLSNLDDKISSDITDLTEQVSRGSGSYALVDINTPGRGGSGTVITDTSASHGKAVQITTSSSANYASYTGNFSDVKFGHYAICARVKTNNLTSSNLVQLKVLNGATEILAANFTGAQFGVANGYAYLYSTFKYESISSAKQILSFQLHTHKINGVQVTFDYAYISMIIPSVFL